MEAKFVSYIFSFLKSSISDFDRKKFGIITPYNGQAEFIRKTIKEDFETAFSEVEVNSIDGFQGREKDIIIVSTVRSCIEAHQNKKTTSIGFLKDARRMNVSLSRARVGLIIVGDLDRLRTGITGHWKQLVKYCIGEKRAFNVPEDYREKEYFKSFCENPEKFLIKPKQKRQKKVKQEIKEGDGDKLVLEEN